MLWCISDRSYNILKFGVFSPHVYSFEILAQKYFLKFLAVKSPFRPNVTQTLRNEKDLKKCNAALSS